MKKSKKRRDALIQGESAKKVKTNRKTAAIVLTAVAIILALGIMSYLRFTGYAVLSDADAFAGKDVYKVGEIVHLFIIPSDADYTTIRVYDPNGNLYSTSLDFPATRIGRYKVKVILMEGDEIKEIQTSFRVEPLETENKTINETSGIETNETPIIGMNETLNETNETQNNITENITVTIGNESIVNESINQSTINFTITKIEENGTAVENLSGEIKCLQFNESLLFSSNYSISPQGSTNYQTWYPENNCATLNVSGCFIGELDVKTRFFSFEDSNQQGEGYVQIANQEGFVCDEPEQGTYENYIAYESLRGEDKRLDRYCGNNKNPNAKCAIDASEVTGYTPTCIGMKAHATKNFLVDVIEAEYSICWREDEQ